MSSGDMWVYQRAFNKYLSENHNVKAGSIYPDDFEWMINVIRKDAFKAGVEYGIELGKKMEVTEGLSEILTTEEDGDTFDELLVEDKVTL